jgi:hypothetical protein
VGLIWAQDLIEAVGGHRVVQARGHPGGKGQGGQPEAVAGSLGELIDQGL